MNFDKSADEFDKLLDEFLNEEIEACIKRHDAQFDFQNGAVPEYYSFRAYKSRGTEYSIPTCHKETFCENQYKRCEMYISTDHWKYWEEDQE